MSYLYRTGNGRNNIAFTTTANSSTKYLRRTNSGRNNIVWTTIPSGSTYNILNRTGTGRNNIIWKNLQIAGPNDLIKQSNISGNFTIGTAIAGLFSMRYNYRLDRIYLLTGGWSAGSTAGTTISNMYYILGNVTVRPAQYRVTMDRDITCPDNFRLLLNRIYIYADDDNYVIIPVSANENISWYYDFEPSNVITKQNGTLYTQLHRCDYLFSDWDRDKTPITTVFYHWE